MRLWPDDWAEILLPNAPLAELVVRTAVIYLVLVVALRLFGRREVGRVTLSDILLLLLIATAVRRGITGGYSSVGDALILGGLLIILDWLLSLLAYRSEWVHRALYARPLPIIRNGRILRENAQRELLTPDEIRQALRERGVRTVAEVEEAFLEPNGEVSVFTRRRRADAPREAE